MLNRSAAVIGTEPIFLEWLQTIGVSADSIRRKSTVADRRVYLIPACATVDEGEEVIEDFFQEIFLRELRAWQADASQWPDTGDFRLFTRWFTVDVVPEVDDIGRGGISEEEPESNRVCQRSSPISRRAVPRRNAAWRSGE